MTVSEFRVADAIFQHALCPHREVHKISYAPIDELLKGSSMMFESLERDDPFQREIMRRLWVLRATVLFTLLPFDHENLGLENCARSLLEMARCVPSAMEHAERVNEITRYLQQNPANPKRERITELLDKDCLHGRRTCIVAVLSPGVVPGWPPAIFEELRAHQAMPTIISSRKVLFAGVFDRTILPSNGRNCSTQMMHDLNYACRSRTVDIFTYAREYFRPPSRHILPPSRVFSMPVRPEEPEESEEEHFLEKIDGWHNEEFWTAVRKNYGAVSCPVTSAIPEAVVKARYVIFANATGTFLPEDRKVIEISDLIDGRATIQDFGGRYPRKHASDLEAGDLVVLRLSGSGDYLEQVADGLIRTDGKGNLRDRATDWKAVLRTTLELHGADTVAKRLAAIGYPLSFPDYVWVWTTDLIISPRKEGEFRDLVGIISELGQLRGKDPLEYAASRWRFIRELKQYHLQAGNLIRKAMLSRLTDLINERACIDDFMQISLANVDAGEMGILRVSAVDCDTAIVSYTKINHFDRIGSY